MVGFEGTGVRQEVAGDMYTVVIIYHIFLRSHLLIPSGMDKTMFCIACRSSNLRNCLDPGPAVEKMTS